MCPSDITFTDCGPAPDISYGHLQFSNYRNSVSAALDCNDGFSIRGSSKIDCYKNGTWIYTDAECVNTGIT